MKRLYWKAIFFSIYLALGIYLFMPTTQVVAQDVKNSEPNQMAKHMDPNEIDSHIAGLSDKQVRQAYVQKLKQEATGLSDSKKASKKGSLWSAVSSKFYGTAQDVSAVFKWMGSIFVGAGIDSSQWRDAIEKLSDGKGALYLFWTIAGVVVIIALGFVTLWLFRRATSDIQKNIINAVRLGKLQFFGRVLSRMLLDALGIGVYILTTFTIFVIVYKQGKSNYIIASVYLIISYFIMVLTFAARVIIAPKSPSLRLFPMEDTDASFLYQWIIRIVLIVGIIDGISEILNQLAISRQLYLLMYGSTGIVIIIALVIMIWQSRKRVAQAILIQESDTIEDAKTLQATFARSWHYFATLFVMVAGAIWVTKALNEENVSVLNLITSIFLIPIVIGVDQWVQRLLKIASGESRETIDLSDDEPPKPDKQLEAGSKMDMKHYVPLVKRFFRIFLVAFLFFGSLRLWGVDISIGRMFTDTVLSILVVLLLSFITWQLIKVRIDQKLKEEMPDDDEVMEEGVAGGSRMGTLLVLLRKFILSVIFVIGSLIVLSSLGIDIVPLIAGAGVIGLAIGFGAQTLVKDIIAGVFFLIDDAFRVGDYVETSGSRGTVEQISLRSLKLRNPRGMVYTIPFGSMGTVANHSRDFTITTLDFRVRYDTDVDKVRKIIKNINDEIMKDEEIVPVLLDKIKSQGVKQMDDSAMIMRVKFKTIPGKQFLVRREVYRLIQERFKENGIEFAHRNVTVYFPPETAETSSDESGGTGTEKKTDKKMIAAGAAAAAVAQAEEEAQKSEATKK